MTTLALIARHYHKYTTRRCKSTDSSIDCKFCSCPKSVILDCDLIHAAKKFLGVACDCIVFEIDGILHVGVVEFKGKGYNLYHALEQLKAGENLAAQIMSKLRIKNYKIYRILVAPSHTSSSILLKSLKKGSQSSKRSRLITATCGDAFCKARKPHKSR